MPAEGPEVFEPGADARHRRKGQSTVTSKGLDAAIRGRWGDKEATSCDVFVSQEFETRNEKDVHRRFFSAGPEVEHLTTWFDLVPGSRQCFSLPTLAHEDCIGAILIGPLRVMRSKEPKCDKNNAYEMQFPTLAPPCERCKSVSLMFECCVLI